MTAATVEEPSLSKTSLDKAKIKVVLLEGVHPTAIEAFEANGYSWIENHPKSLPPSELKAVLADAYIVGIRSATSLTAGLLEHAEKLICVGCFCIGTNQVELNAAEKLGVPVFNAPFSNTRSVAELVLAEAIMLTRGIPSRNAGTHRGEWNKSAIGSSDVPVANDPQTFPAHFVTADRGLIPLAAMRSGVARRNPTRQQDRLGQH